MFFPIHSPRRPSSLFAAIALTVFAVAAHGAPGDSIIAAWHANRTGVFLLFFDDSCPSHYQVVIPELLKRGLTATFYVNPGKWTGANGEIANQWRNVIPKTAMVYGNHTMTHRGVKDMEHAEYEIGECTKIILDLRFPDGKPHLISWGLPGVGKGAWNITQDQLQALFEKYHLVSRPKTDQAHRAFVGVKTAPEMLALADKAIAGKSMEFLVVHGVQRRPEEGDPSWSFQDFWPLDKDILRAVLDGLAERQNRGDLWVADHISQYKYQRERESNPRCEVLAAAAQAIRLKWTCPLDPELFDQPLTVTTEVPSGWDAAIVSQGEKRQRVSVVKSHIQYDMVPDGTPVVLTPAPKSNP